MFFSSARPRREPLVRERLLRDAAREDGRLEARGRRTRKDRAVPRVERDDRSATCRPLAVVLRESDAVLQRLLGGLLQPEVEREPERVPGLRQQGRDDGAVRMVQRVDVQALRAGDTAQVAVVRRLDAALADLVTGLIPRRCEGVELVARDLAHVAEQLCSERVVRIVANVRRAERHARELVRVLGEIVAERLARAVANGDRGERVASPRLDACCDLIERHLCQTRDALELPVTLDVDLRQVGGPELHGCRRGVHHEGLSVAIDDRAPRRLDAHGPIRVRAGLVDVLRPGEHLQRPEPEEERSEDDEHDDAERADAPGEAMRDAPGLDRGLLLRRCPLPRWGRWRRWPLRRRASQGAEPRSRHRIGRTAAETRRASAYTGAVRMRFNTMDGTSPRSIGPAGARSPSTKCTISSPNE